MRPDRPRRRGASSGRLVVALLLAASSARLAVAQAGPVKTDHFFVYAESGATERQAKQVAALAEHAFGRVTGDIGYVPSEPIVVLAFDDSEGFLSGREPQAAVGLVEFPHNIIRIALWRAREQLYPVVAHEVAHVVLAWALRSDMEKVPRWFNEGVATWVSRIWAPEDDAHAHELAAAGRAAPPDALSRRFRSSSEQEIQDAYVQSAAMVEYLTRLGGPEAIARVVRDLRHAPDFDAALRQAAGVTQGQLYERWMREYGGRWRWPHWGNVGADMMVYVLVTVLCVIIGWRIWQRRWLWREAHDEEDGLTAEELERAREIEAEYRHDEERS